MGKMLIALLRVNLDCTQLFHMCFGFYFAKSVLRGFLFSFVFNSLF